MQEPKTHWPANVELYDSKGVVKAGKGVGQKTFEFLLIPRQPGTLELPSLEFGFFDPKKGQYVTKATQPIKINVLDPLPGSDGLRTEVSPPAASASHKANNPANGKIAAEASGTEASWRYLHCFVSGSSDVALDLLAFSGSFRDYSFCWFFVICLRKPQDRVRAKCDSSQAGSQELGKAQSIGRENAGRNAVGRSRDHLRRDRADNF